MSLEVVILGCGSSGGVPRGDGDWGACDPAEPRNRRTRCSMLARRTGPDGVTNVLIDTSPDLREQMLASGTNGTTSVAPIRGCSPCCRFISISSAAMAMAEKAAAATA